MNRALLAAWRATVRHDDTIICLGDVAHPDFWSDRRHSGDLRACPGRRILIMGNHDIGQTEDLNRAGFTVRHWAAILDSDPPAALTHAPLRHQPIPAINIHGHLHGAEGRFEAARQRERGTHGLPAGPAQQRAPAAQGSAHRETPPVNRVCARHHLVCFPCSGNGT